MFLRKIEIYPNEVGFLYKKNSFSKNLESGVYKLCPFSDSKIFKLPKNSLILNITNQELLSKDSVAFRFSYFLSYEIFDFEKCLNWLDFNQEFLPQIDLKVSNLSKIFAREILAKLQTEEIIERNFEFDLEILNKKLENFGIKVGEFEIIDATFPKQIQDIFSKKLESKLRAQIDLENARTTIATARALKNAASMLDENTKFLQVLEILQQATKNGKNSFNLGEILK